MSSQEITVDFSKSSDFDSNHQIGSTILHHAFAQHCDSEANDCSYDVFYEDDMIFVQYDYQWFDNQGKEIDNHVSQAELISRTHSSTSKLDRFKLEKKAKKLLDSFLEKLDEKVAIQQPIIKLQYDLQEAINEVKKYNHEGASHTYETRYDRSLSLKLVS